MARTIRLDGTNDLSKLLSRSFQSGHINFLIGSGASLPAIATAGAVEQQIADLLAIGDQTEAYQRMYEFLLSVQVPSNKLIANVDDPKNTATLQNYTEYLRTIEILLSERRTTLLPKQATIFTTNYDLFIEKASIQFPAMTLNDGFTRAPRLDGRMQYSSRNFFNKTYNIGNLYNYRVEIPCINLIKLHGSLSWRRDHADFLFDVVARDPLDPLVATDDEVKQFIESYGVVLPHASKFEATLMERTYYDLLRIFANELDRENALLVAFGFSFADEHVRDIVSRGLKNPTLRLMTFAYSDIDAVRFTNLFEGNANVDVIAPKSGEIIDFAAFNAALRGTLPAATT
jgi:SIR2-like domain